MHSLNNYPELKNFLAHIVDAAALLFGIANGVDYISTKITGTSLLLSKFINSMGYHFYFQEFFFIIGGFLSLAWLYFRMLTQYRKALKAKEELDDAKEDDES